MNQKVGFYLHTSWEFKYPFAVRSWQREDFAGWCRLMRLLDMNLLMLWPLYEAMPAPLSCEDRAALKDWRDIIKDARESGMECWITHCANVSCAPEIAAKPFKKRHLYPFRVDVNLEDDAARESYLCHRADVMRALDNADGYVTIDGDPGSYPDARPERFVEVLQHDRVLLDEIGRRDAQIVPWLWAGWGGDWEKYGVWQQPIAPLTAPLLQKIKDELAPPRTFLPGRSIREDWANGRENIALAEDAGLIEESVLLCYEIIEYEPTPPGIVLQFDDIRRVLKQEEPLLQKARGIMGNTQQPIMALPNLYFFARAARDFAYLRSDDETVLRDLANFFGGPEEILVAAWRCGHLPLSQIPADLPLRLRAASLQSEAAASLPGGAARYLEILAAWVEARLGILNACAETLSPESASRAVEVLVAWWNVHRYVFTGENGDGFRAEYAHPLLLDAVRAWNSQFSGDRAALQKETIGILGAQNCLPLAQIETAVTSLFS